MELFVNCIQYASLIALTVAMLAAPATSAGVVPPQNAPDWREQVKTRKVVQPETDAGPWKFMAQPFPPIASVVAQQAAEINEMLLAGGPLRQRDALPLGDELGGSYSAG